MLLILSGSPNRKVKLKKRKGKSSGLMARSKEQLLVSVRLVLFLALPSLPGQVQAASAFIITYFIELYCFFKVIISMATRRCSRHQGGMTVTVELGMSTDKGRGERSGGIKNFEGKGVGWTWKSTKDILILNSRSWKFLICSCLLSQANIVAVFIFLTVKRKYR